jgi:hypothetical protein
MTKFKLYPVLIDPVADHGYNFVYIPDFDGYTQGKGVKDSIRMAISYITESTAESITPNANLDSSAYPHRKYPDAIRVLVAVPELD